MTETAKHTPTPWKSAYQFKRNHKTLGILGADGLLLASVWIKGNQVQGEANADFIVQACNSHEALIEACKALRDAYDAGADGIAIAWDDVDHAYHLALNAIGTD